MVICKMRGPIKESGWEHSFFDLETLPALPAVPLSLARARFPEHRLEFSFLREPSALLDGLGVSKCERIIILRQVSQVDIYLSIGDSLHLLEVKGITGSHPFQESLPAAKQILRYWLQKGRWFRTNKKSVKLWSLCPIDWKDGRPRLPVDLWTSELADLKATSLQGEYLADIGLAFYSVFSWPPEADQRVTEASTETPPVPELLFVMWRADEAIPTIATKN